MRDEFGKERETMKRAHRWTAAAVAFIIGAGILTMPMAAQASEEGRRNPAIGLGALAAGLLLTQKNKLPGIIAGVGAAVAYGNYQKKVDERHRWDRYGYYDNRYDRNYDQGYRYDGNNYSSDRYSGYDRY